MIAYKKYFKFVFHVVHMVRILMHLFQFSPDKRTELLSLCGSTLRDLEVRAIPGETTLSLMLPELTSLTVDQGIHLESLG